MANNSDVCIPITNGQGSNERLSIIHGSIEHPLLNLHLGQLLDRQALRFGKRTAIVCPSSQTRLTYCDLRDRTRSTAKGLIEIGVRRGDVISILAGNRVEYVELFLAAGRIGAILAVLNTTYTSDELVHALEHTGSKILFTAPRLGAYDNFANLSALKSSTETFKLSKLEKIILFDVDDRFDLFLNYSKIVRDASLHSIITLEEYEATVCQHDICNLQFTSGTTGNPKAAMLTHHNLINNAVFVGDRMKLRKEDILCSPPPLFHCFGLVLGLLATLTHGSSIVFPSESFNAKATLDAVLQEGCTALHGVPAMWIAEMSLVRRGDDFSKLRTGIAAGSATPRQMLEDLELKLHLLELTNTYGMTETSPASFMTSCEDPLERRLSTVGKILPHTSAKIIDPEGKIVALGNKGELCIAGYLLQRGYWRNQEKTQEVMVRDEAGTLWMHTGDEACFDEEGWCMITGRLKDMIIRGGENIFPLEIEQRLMQHPDILNASVVGIYDKKYGETVGVFLQSKIRVQQKDIQAWVQQKLARHKVPQHIFYLGERDVGFEFPLTGSGKVKKNVLRELGNRLLKQRGSSRL